MYSPFTKVFKLWNVKGQLKLLFYYKIHLFIQREGGRERISATGPGDGTPILWLNWKCIYLLSHFIHFNISIFVFYEKLFWMTTRNVLALGGRNRASIKARTTFIHCHILHSKVISQAQMIPFTYVLFCNLRAQPHGWPAFIFTIPLRTGRAGVICIIFSSWRNKNQESAVETVSFPFCLE